MLCIYSMCIIMYIYYSCFHDGINNIDRQINTMFYNNGSIYTNYWIHGLVKTNKLKKSFRLKDMLTFSGKMVKL